MIHRMPLFQSLILHGGLLSLFLFGFKHQNTIVEPQAELEIVQAMILDETKIQAEVERLRNQENRQRLAETNRRQQLENRRKEEERRLLEAKNQRKQEKKQARAEEKKRQALKSEQMKKLAELRNQQDAEAKRLVEIKKQQEETEEKRIVEEKRLAELEEKRKSELERRKQEAALLKQKQAELALKQQRKAKKNAADLRKLKKAIADARILIQQKVKQNWIQPSQPESGLSCKIQVKLIPGGEVIDARVIQSSGARAFDRSAETAVLKASPLPVPTDPSLFSRFRTFEFIFKPQ